MNLFIIEVEPEWIFLFSGKLCIEKEWFHVRSINNVRIGLYLLPQLFPATFCSIFRKEYYALKQNLNKEYSSLLKSLTNLLGL